VYNYEGYLDEDDEPQPSQIDGKKKSTILQQRDSLFNPTSMIDEFNKKLLEGEL